MQEIRDLIFKARQGDLDAFDRIILKFRDMAVGYAYSQLGDFHLAEDAAQEAFIQAFRDLKVLREPHAFPSWFKRIVFKYCDRFKRRKRPPAHSIDAGIDVPSPGESHPDLYLKQEIRSEILKNIQSLTEKERTATTLFYINGYSLHEVGAFLDIPATTVKSRLHTSRKKLKKRMVEMVKESLTQNAPGDEFNLRIRKVLEKVPVVGFQLHQKKEKSGLRRCPESMPFPSCLRSCLEFMNENLGFKKILVMNKEWRLDTTYVYLMGTTGAAFRLSWKPGWYMGNPAMNLITEDPLEPYVNGIESLGYEYEILPGNKLPLDEENTKRKILESIREHRRPVIAKGVVGPPVECLITGFDRSGEVLIGWSYFQGAKEFSRDIEFEPDGYFRKQNWFKDTHMLIILGEKKGTYPMEEAYRASLRRAVHIARAPLVQGDCAGGFAAYEAWAQAVLDDREFIDKKVKELHHRYHVHMDATGIIAEGRWYAHNFLHQIIENIPCPEKELLKAAECYHHQHDLIWKMWGLVGGPGASVTKAKAFSAPGLRKKSAAVIREALNWEKQAVNHLERALQNW